MESPIRLDHPIRLKWLLLFSLPTIISSIFANLYSTVDGVFVSRLVSTDGLSAVNITMPIIYLITGVGTMFASGGTALTARLIGEGKEAEARQDFSFLIAAALAASIILTVIGFIWLDPICRLMGSDTELLTYCRAYMIPILVLIPFTVFETMFQFSYITVGKAKIGLWLSVVGGIVNIVLDCVFIVNFGWGISGAAIATGIGHAIPSIYGLIYFSVKKDQVLFLTKPVHHRGVLLKTCTNGSSEMVSVLAFSVVTLLFNNILMRLAGSDGVASLSMIWYAQGLFGGMFRGYITGVSPIISYNLGREDRDRLSRLFRLSVRIVVAAGLAVTVLSLILSPVVIRMFCGDNHAVYEIALYGFQIVALSFTLMGMNVFASGWFTALNDGITSALLSFSRTILFMVVPVLILPRFLGVDGVWWSMTAGEAMSLGLAVYFFRRSRSVWTPKEEKQAA